MLDRQYICFIVTAASKFFLVSNGKEIMRINWVGFLIFIVSDNPHKLLNFKNYSKEYDPSLFLLITNWWSLLTRPLCSFLLSPHHKS